MKKLISKFRSEKGQSMVELALTLPFVLAILCGILDFGWIFSNTYKVEYAASVGARYAAIHATEYSDAQLTATVSTEVNRALGGGMSPNISIAKSANEIQVTVSCPVRTLTFVASILWGNYYPASCTVTTAY